MNTVTANIAAIPGQGPIISTGAMPVINDRPYGPITAVEHAVMLAVKHDVESMKCVGDDVYLLTDVTGRGRKKLSKYNKVAI